MCEKVNGPLFSVNYVHGFCNLRAFFNENTLATLFTSHLTLHLAEIPEAGSPKVLKMKPFYNFSSVCETNDGDEGR